MLSRLVYALGPGADEIGTRAFGLASRGYWTVAFAGPMRFGVCPETKILVAIADSPADLASACLVLDRNESMFHGWKVLAYSSRAAKPRPCWLSSSRFQIHLTTIQSPLDRFQALQATSALLGLLDASSEVIEDRIRYAIRS